MQIVDNHNIIKRQIYYASSLYYTSIKESEKYENTKRVIIIAITDFNVYENDYSYIAESKFYMKEKDNEGVEHIVENLDKEIKLYTIQLPKFRKSHHDLNRKVDQWLSVIDGKSLSELQTAVAKNGEIMKAMEKVEELTSDEYIIEIISKEEDDKKNTADRESYAYNSGVKQGIKQGVEQGVEQGIEQGIERGGKEAKIKIIENLAKMKIGLKDIAKSVDMSIEEVKKILDR